ncbi:MAG: ATP-binding protein [Oscillospiraceae bacterium]|nr:ATP-binding protein [Oscillospiraceae bacterium]
MVNINGKEWTKLVASDIQNVISEQDFDESFYFEFKDDRVSNKKITEEVSAFANTFGGYIFLGISDDKQIEGCTAWNEQRIHTTIHDSITPTPSFDVKKFTIGPNVIYVIRINEGAEPPYITSSGKIYERLSSGSFTIKDSSKLSQIYNKKEQLLAKMENKISIPRIHENTNNIYGYIDTGFCLVPSDAQVAFDTFNRADLKAIAQKMANLLPSFSLSNIGNSIFFTPGGLSTQKGHLPAHTNNFLEIMADGSARMRILLINNDQDDSSVNMMFPVTILRLYKDIYTKIMGDLFPHKIAYAKKYESLTVRQQFKPVLFYDESVIELHPDWKEDNRKMLEALRSHRKVFGTKTVVTDDRIPKTGLYTIDKRQLELWGVEYTANSFIDELFFSRFNEMGIVHFEEENLN